MNEIYPYDSEATIYYGKFMLLDTKTEGFAHDGMRSLLFYINPVKLHLINSLAKA